MPRLPVLDLPEVQQRPIGTPYSNVRATPEQYGAGFGQALSQAGSELGKIADAEKKRADDYQTDLADIEMSRRMTRGMYGGKNEKGEATPGYMNLKSGDANNVDPLYKGFQADEEDIAKTLLTNDEQRNAFRLRAKSRVEQARDTIERHAAQQREAYYKEISEGAVQSAFNSASLNPDTVESEVQKVLVKPDGMPGPLRRALGDQGYPAEKIEQVEGEFRRKAYAAAIDGLLLRKDLAGAQKYFEQFKPILGADAPAVGKKIQDKTAELEEETEKQRLGRVFQQIHDAGGRLDLKNPDFLALNDWDKSRAKEKQFHIKLSLRQLSAEERRIQAEKNQLALKAFGALTPQEQAKVDLFSGFQPGDSADDTTNFILTALQNRAIADQEKKLMPERAEFETVARNSTKGMGKKRAEAFIQEAMFRRAQWYDKHEGKGPTREEMKKILSDMTREDVVEGMFWDTTKQSWEVKPTDKVKPRPGAAPPPAAAPTKLPKRERVKELMQKRVPRDQIDAILKSEGYK